MDINSIDSTIQQDEEGAVVPLMQKNGEPELAADGSPATITVVGSDSARYRRAQDAQTRRLLRMKRKQLTPDDIRENRIELASAAVLDWHGIESNGEPVPCTPEHVKSLLRASWILSQVEDAIESHADFFAPRSTNSVAP